VSSLSGIYITAPLDVAYCLASPDWCRVHTSQWPATSFSFD